MPSPKTMVVSSPHTMATSTLRSHARQEAMEATNLPLVKKQLVSFFLSQEGESEMILKHKK